MMQHQASPSSASLSDDDKVSIDQNKTLVDSYSSRYKRQRVPNAQTRNFGFGKFCTCYWACVYGKGLQVNFAMT